MARQSPLQLHLQLQWLLLKRLQRCQLPLLLRCQLLQSPLPSALQRKSLPPPQSPPLLLLLLRSPLPRQGPRSGSATLTQ